MYVQASGETFTWVGIDNDDTVLGSNAVVNVFTGDVYKPDGVTRWGDIQALRFDQIDKDLSIFIDARSVENRYWGQISHFNKMYGQPCPDDYVINSSTVNLERYLQFSKMIKDEIDEALELKDLKDVDYKVAVSDLLVDITVFLSTEIRRSVNITEGNPYFYNPEYDHALLIDHLKNTNFTFNSPDKLYDFLLEEFDKMDKAIVRMSGYPPMVFQGCAVSYYQQFMFAITQLAYTIGIPFRLVREIVMRSNFSKLGEDGLPIIKDGKVQKGPNYWKPEPYIEKIFTEGFKPLVILSSNVT